MTAVKTLINNYMFIYTLKANVTGYTVVKWY